MEPFGNRGGGWQDYRWNHRPNRIPHHYDRKKNDFKMRRDLHRNSGTPKNPYKKINKPLQRQNFKFPQKRKIESIKPLLSPVDPEEEERKKKLTDTANKLLSKIKTWSAECSVSESEEKSKGESEQSVSVPSGAEGKPKRIAHSKSKKLGKKPVQKKSKKSARTMVSSEKYDVNKATVKDFQNRIQHKLINEIMQMPKESLQNVLNDPKINPIMELKMSRLVRENKLLIAQRLRALAESKMTSKDFAKSSQLLVDIDKLIDPVIETDLSVLPYELIQQMENIFQVQFDYPKSGINPPNMEANDLNSEGAIEMKLDACVSSVIDSLPDEIKPLLEATTDHLSSAAGDEINECEDAVTEDTRVYECSTDEDDNLECNNSEHAELSESVWGTSHMETEFQNESCLEDNSGQIKPVRTNLLSENNLVSGQSETSVEKFRTAETQTESFYMVPSIASNSPEALLEEINTIQNTINQLNERRFRIFLELAKSNPTGGFLQNQSACNSFVETLSNGSISLVESLNNFFGSRNQWFGAKSRKPRSYKKRTSKFQNVSSLQST